MNKQIFIIPIKREVLFEKCYYVSNALMEADLFLFQTIDNCIVLKNINGWKYSTFFIKNGEILFEFNEQKGVIFDFDKIWFPLIKICEKEGIKPSYILKTIISEYLKIKITGISYVVSSPSYNYRWANFLSGCSKHILNDE